MATVVSQDYSREGMTECQEKLVQHLRMFGLVYQRKVMVCSIHRENRLHGEMYSDNDTKDFNVCIW